MSFLRQLGYTVFPYNPLIIKEFAKSQSLRKTKTDVKDALLIARKLWSDETTEPYQNDEMMDQLKELTRYQNRLIQERSKNKNLYVRLLDIVFPELQSVVGNLHNNYVYELLTKYPTPAKIKRAHLSSLLNINYLTADKAKKIQETAALTIGQPSPALTLELLQLIETIRHYDKQMTQVQEQINDMMVELDSPITSITGIGNRLGAIILAEIKSIHHSRLPLNFKPSPVLSQLFFNLGRLTRLEGWSNVAHPICGMHSYRQLS